MNIKYNGTYVTYMYHELTWIPGTHTIQGLRVLYTVIMYKGHTRYNPGYWGYLVFRD